MTITVEIGRQSWSPKEETFRSLPMVPGVWWAREAMNQFPDVKADILDLRTLFPGIKSRCTNRSQDKPGNNIA